LKNNLQREYDSLKFENKERVKELTAIYRVTDIIKQNRALESTLKAIAQILPSAWQYPEDTVCRISYGNVSASSVGFETTQWRLTQNIGWDNNKRGIIEVYYLKEMPNADVGPFLHQEVQLLDVIGNMITGFIKSSIGRLELESSTPGAEEINNENLSDDLLQKFISKQNRQRDIYHDLMPFKVKEILLVSTLYDAFNIDRERRSSDSILGEYHKLNLTSVPRITGVSSVDQAIILMQKKHFDLVIVMSSSTSDLPAEVSAIIKKAFPYIPLFLLVNNRIIDSKLNYNELISKQIVDKVFEWNGDTRIFFAMVKYLEDKVNVANDTQIGLVRVIILVEDSAEYYSRYLPSLYNILMEQIKDVIEEVNTDDLYKVLRMRCRPKLLLTDNYEEAIKLFETYKNYMLCLITDMQFFKNGIHDSNAGESLIRKVRKSIKDLPIIAQSTHQLNDEIISDLGVTFINKQSKGFAKQLKEFIKHNLGFGNFIFRDNHTSFISEAATLQELERLLHIIPDSSLEYHGKRNHFSSWLMARGEIELARIILPFKVSDFKNIGDLRNLLINYIQNFRNTAQKGQVIPFSSDNLHDLRNIFTMASGSLGGKGRGLAFINTLVHNLDFSDMIPDMNVNIPITCIIGTDEFDSFLNSNNLVPKVYQIKDYSEIKKLFIKAELNSKLKDDLYTWLRFSEEPLAVRSSALLEDSLLQPFAGIFDTYLLPNNNSDINQRFNQLQDAIKMVFASVFSPDALKYFEAIDFKVEDEKMAVVIQEVVGKKNHSYFYSDISGVAQSYNFYPVGHAKPADGLAVIAIGLGKYVVEGNRAFRFSPKYPELDFLSAKDLLKNSQSKFIAIDMSKKNVDFTKGQEESLATLDLYDAEKFGSLKHCASVYNVENDTLEAGITAIGPRIINFQNILKYKYIPLAATISSVLNIIRKAFGSPVEIEFAVDLNKSKNNKATFYLLQIKPMIAQINHQAINNNLFKDKEPFILSTEAMGNGYFENIQHIMMVDNDVFDKSKTVEIAEQIDGLNTYCVKEHIKYILIGPGRWGTRDRWIGIPVSWPQISQAKVIIETDLDNFPLDASSGSHFFHNVTSMNVGYASISKNSTTDFINYQLISEQRVIKQTKFVKLVKVKRKMMVLMNGVIKELSVYTE